MAWNIQVSSDRPTLDADMTYSAQFPLLWGEYYIVIIKFGPNEDVFGFSFEHDNTAIGYLCADVSDINNTNGVPNNYVLAFNSSQKQYAQVVTGQNYLLVLRAASSSQAGGTEVVEVSALGGGGGGNQYYTATGDTTNLSITLAVDNYSGLQYDDFIYSIKPYGSSSWTDYTTSSDSYTFTGLSAQEYVVAVSYTYQGNVYDIPTEPGGSTYTSIIDLSGGGGGGNPYFTASGDTSNLSIAINVDGYSGLSYDTFTYSIRRYGQSGWTDYSTSSTSHTFTGLSSAEYEVAVAYSYQGQDHNVPTTAGGSTYVTTIDLTVPQWGYSLVVGYSNLSTSERKLVSLSGRAGKYFEVSFAYNGTATISVPSGAAVDLFVTNANYGYDSADGYPYVNSGNKAVSSLSHSVNVTAGSSYYVWIKLASGTGTGGISIDIVPPTASTTWTEVYKGDIQVTTSTRSERLVMESRKTYRYNLTFQDSGIIRIYSTGASSSQDVVAYFGTTNGGIRESTGVPNNYNNIWDNTSASDYNFNSGDISVSSGTTYYLYIKPKESNMAPTINVYVTSPANNKGFWIGVNGNWVKTTVYVGVNRNWSTSMPCLGVNSAWEQGS